FIPKPLLRFALIHRFDQKTGSIAEFLDGYRSFIAYSTFSTFFASQKGPKPLLRPLRCAIQRTLFHFYLLLTRWR
ncbi:MAG: hypothetical protein U0J65_00875, partial [Christensenellales bacterium]|nr:hypothetical protein [Christensenellales bacterium]